MIVSLVAEIVIFRSGNESIGDGCGVGGGNSGGSGNMLRVWEPNTGISCQDAPPLHRMFRRLFLEHGSLLQQGGGGGG